MLIRIIRASFIATLFIGLGACTTASYYSQSVRGQLDVLSKRQAIADLVADAHTPADLKAKLQNVLRMRAFATDTLHLPDNGSYRSYADIGREHVVWSVYATPELSLDARQWCFPVVGCVGYRGYFAQENAEHFADTLRAAGDDVYVAEVDAYSTLGWFDDPILNTILQRKEAYIASLIFHELAHQQLYIKNDTAFNESFARAVEIEGTRRWLIQQDAARRDYELGEARNRDFVALIARTRERLHSVFAATATSEQKRARKQEVYAQLRAEYSDLKQTWGGYNGYDAWLNTNLNNAKLAAVATYADFVPAFQKLLQEKNGDMAAFYSAAKEIGDLPAERRRARLAALTPSTP